MKKPYLFAVGVAVTIALSSCASMMAGMALGDSKKALAEGAYERAVSFAATAVKDGKFEHEEANANLPTIYSESVSALKAKIEGMKSDQSLAGLMAQAEAYRILIAITKNITDNNLDTYSNPKTGTAYTVPVADYTEEVNGVAAALVQFGKTKLAGKTISGAREASTAFDQAKALYGAGVPADLAALIKEANAEATIDLYFVSPDGWNDGSNFMLEKLAEGYSGYTKAHYGFMDALAKYQDWADDEPALVEKRQSGVIPYVKDATALMSFAKAIGADLVVYLEQKPASDKPIKDSKETKLIKGMYSLSELAADGKNFKYTLPAGGIDHSKDIKVDGEISIFTSTLTTTAAVTVYAAAPASGKTVSFKNQNVEATNSYVYATQKAVNVPKAAGTISAEYYKLNADSGLDWDAWMEANHIATGYIMTDFAYSGKTVKDNDLPKAQQELAEWRESLALLINSSELSKNKVPLIKKQYEGLIQAIENN